MRKWLVEIGTPNGLRSRAFTSSSLVLRTNNKMKNSFGH